jgi:N-acetylneuraminic acid mutarotase
MVNDAGSDQVSPPVDSAQPTDGPAQVIDAFSKLDAFRTGPTISALSSAGAPLGRALLAMVWTGSVAVVWGGGDADVLDTFIYNTGGRYEPRSDSWSPMSTSGAPSPRYAPVAVWTGSEMVVWGGQTMTEFINNGARYDPVADVWRPMSASGAAVPGVVGNSGAWTGQVLMTSNGLQAGFYDPATDAWTAMPDPPAPTQLQGQVIVWTGRDLLVWGGTDFSKCLNSGLRYHPNTNLWTPMAATGAPQPRCVPHVQWDGAEMLVFGGYDGASFLADGAIYNPDTDTWRPMTTNGALSPRSNFVEVWTGNKLVIWGGNDTRVVFGTGAEYDPASDVWTAFSVPLNTRGLFGGSAVWTGAEVLAWGGDAMQPGTYPSAGVRISF